MGGPVAQEVSVILLVRDSWYSKGVYDFYTLRCLVQDLYIPFLGRPTDDAVAPSSSVKPNWFLAVNQLMPMVLLVVQWDKSPFGSSGPEPPVIAGAIAVFQYNNQNCTEMDLPTLDMMTIPCTTVKGTRPLFDKVLVTRHLSDWVATGKTPMEKTVVTRCGPHAPPEPYEGMEFLDYRCTALRYYYTFRDLLVSFPHGL